MCGIAGYFGSRAIPSDHRDACLMLMGRRGPDHAGQRHWTNPAGKHVYLLHARLRIIDLDERANQPFQIGTQWITYNGELYNYKELRPRLAVQGFPFRTESDTEVLLGAINVFGWDVLDQCEGMWALAASAVARMGAGEGIRRCLTSANAAAAR